MRNLHQYPPNADEALQTLNYLSEKLFKDQAPGDMTGLYLEKAIKYLEQNKDQFNKFIIEAEEN